MKASVNFDRLFDGPVDALPPFDEGRVYLLSSDKRLYAAHEGNWVSFGVPFGLVMVERDSGTIVQYNGAEFLPVVANEQVDYQPQINNLLNLIENIPATVTTSVVTIAALKCLPHSQYAGKKVFLDAGGRQGDFILRAGTIPTADPNECVYIASLETGFYWERTLGGAVNFLWCGADKNYTVNTDNWATWIQAVRFCGATGRPLYIPAGRYGFKTAPQVIMTEFSTSGILIYGDGQHRSILDMRSVVTSPNFMVSSVSDNYYLTMRDIGMLGNIPGLVCQIGKSDMSDPPNMPRLQNVSIQNFDTTDASRGLLLNYCVGGNFDVQINCGSGGVGGVGGKGIALTMRGCGFNQFFGSIGSASISIQFQDIVNFGNQFNCLDMENVAICVRMAGPAHKSNTFVSGQWSYFVAGIDCQNSVKTKVINPNLWPGAPATEANFIAASVGLTVS